MIEINNEYMSLTIDGETIATARFSRYAAGDDRGAPSPLSPRSSPTNTPTS